MSPQAQSQSDPTQTRISVNSVNTFLSPVVQDQVATGTKKILSSQHISDGPGRIANAPVPSVFRDGRGSINRLRVGGKRINLLQSKAGVMRSGYLHKQAKYDHILSGQVEVWVLTDLGTDKRIYKAHESYMIPAYTPHILYFLEDSILTEMWDQAEETKSWIYHPYRRIVDVQNSLQNTSTGQHHLLVPQLHIDELENQAPAVPKLRSLLWMSTGIVVGAVVSKLLTKKRQ